MMAPPWLTKISTVQFAEYIQRNAQLYSMRNETDLSPSGLAHYVRGELASSLRSRKPYTVNLLMGGVDPITGKPHLYWMDYLASMAEVPYAAHGYAQYVESISSHTILGDTLSGMMADDMLTLFP